jgi:hypothetical protein
MNIHFIKTNDPISMQLSKALYQKRSRETSRKTAGRFFMILIVIFLWQPCKSQVVRKNVDIAVENLTIVNITDSRCGEDFIDISFSLKNKLSTSGVKAKAVIMINGIDETISFTPVVSGCLSFPRNQTITVTARSAIKQSWITPANFILTVTAEACNVEGVVIQYHDINLSNNKQELRDTRLNRVIPGAPVCDCAKLEDLMDTAAQYIIKGDIKLDAQGLVSTPGYLAVTGRLVPVLSKQDAVSVRFKFLGFDIADNSVPLYNIVFALNGLILTEKEFLNTNSYLTFAVDEGLPEQKWWIRKNENSSYSFLCHSSTGQFCMIMGRNENEAPTLQNPAVRPLIASGVPGKYQQFELIKLQ